MPAHRELEHFVRVTGRRAHLVEFDYAIGSADLAVELIMPQDVFAQFCQRVGAKTITPEQAAELDRERAEWREKTVDN